MLLKLKLPAETPKNIPVFRKKCLLKKLNILLYSNLSYKAINTSYYHVFSNTFNRSPKGFKDSIVNISELELGALTELTLLFNHLF